MHEQYENSDHTTAAKMTEHLGIMAVIVMVGAYALEKQHPHFVLLFTIGCGTAALYAWLINSIPFMIAESLWMLIALHRWWGSRLG